MLPLAASATESADACPCLAQKTYTAGDSPRKAGRVTTSQRKALSPTLASLSTSAGKCSDESSGVCSSTPVIKVLAEFAGVKASAEAEAVVEKAAEKIGEGGCKDESCVVNNKKFLNYVRNTKGEQAVRRVIVDSRERFKTPGPRESKELISNYNIDEVLQRWAKEFGSFFNCPFAMIDFDIRPQFQLGMIDMGQVHKGHTSQKLFSFPHPRTVRRKCDTFGCVLNTDVSTGMGKHWVCVFVDMRAKEWTVEYFNSSGRAPPREVTVWMERTANELRSVKAGQTVSTKVVTDVTHQKGDTECGLYSLYYIRSRLEGVPWAKFKEWNIPDDLMTEFRTHLFSSEA